MPLLNTSTSYKRDKLSPYNYINFDIDNTIISKK